MSSNENPETKQAKEDRQFFLDNLKKNNRSNSALKYGFIGMALASAATGVTAGILLGTGSVATTSLLATSVIPLPFIGLPLLAPIIAGIAGIVIASFIAGIIVRYSYTPSKVYTDFYEKYESEQDGQLLIDEISKKGNFKDTNFISKRFNKKKWESQWTSNTKALENWTKKDRLINVYINEIFQALITEDTKKVNNLCKFRLFGTIENMVYRQNNDDIRYTLLHLAAGLGFTDLAKTLLDNNANPNIAANNGQTPIYLAAQKGHINMLSLLTRYGADVNFKSRTDKTPLHYAIRNAQKEAAGLLINIEDADVNDIDIEGITPLHIAAQKDLDTTTQLLIHSGADIHALNVYGGTPLFEAVIYKSSKAVKVLLDNGADIYKLDKNKRIPVYENLQGNFTTTKKIINLIDKEAKKRDEIFEKAKSGELEAELKNIEINDYMLRIRDKEGNSLLHLAAGNNQYALAKKLLENGADIYAINNAKQTPAYLSQNFDIAANINYITELIEEEANKRNAFFEKAKNGQLELEDAEVNNYLLQIRDENGNTLLHIAAKNGHNEIVKKLLKIGFKINAINYAQETPLHLAVRNAQEEMVQLLVDNKANIYAQDKNKNFPVNKAIELKKKQIAQILINNTNTVNYINANKNTPLHYAVHFAIESGDNDIISLLLNRGADINYKNKNGKTPLHLAITRGDNNIISLLLDRGADLNIQDEHGNTPLHLALTIPNADMAQLLINRGANLDILNKAGQSPVDIARERRGTEHIIALIERKKADAITPATAEDNTKKASSSYVSRVRNEGNNIPNQGNNMTVEVETYEHKR